MESVCETIRDFEAILSDLQAVFSRWDGDLIGEGLTPF
jgi:hypothetical protein